VNHDQIVELLQEVTYRPGWTITAHRHHLGSYVLIDAEVLDSEKWDKRVPVDVNYRLGNTTRVGVRACVPPAHQTPKEFYDWLEWRLSKVEIHEMREFFMVGGKPWDSPHKRVQPKHDYHVRRWNAGKCDHPHIEDMGEKWTFCEDVGCSGYVYFWGVYRHDPLAEDELGELLRSYGTMEMAFEQALYEVIQDDLRKGLVGPNG
jgi:hypothetical protein